MIVYTIVAPKKLLIALPYRFRQSCRHGRASGISRIAMHDNLRNFVNILKKRIHNTFGILVGHRFESVYTFGSVDIIELEVFDVSNIFCFLPRLE